MTCITTVKNIKIRLRKGQNSDIVLDKKIKRPDLEKTNEVKIEVKNEVKNETKNILPNYSAK